MSANPRKVLAPGLRPITRLPATPPPIPVHVLMPDEPPDWVLMGCESTVQGTYMSFSCTSCRQLFGVPVGMLPRHTCIKRAKQRAKSITQPGKRVSK